jgi:hypothetical protein
MPLIIVPDYEVRLMDINPALAHVYVEALSGSGGGAKCTRLRLSENGLPITLRENFSDKGTLHQESESRDLRLIQDQLIIISRILNSGRIVCLPSIKIDEEIQTLQKQSPKLAQMILDRLGAMVDVHLQKM